MFGDYLLLSDLEPIVITIAARVWPQSFGAYWPAVAPSFLRINCGGPANSPHYSWE